MAVTRAQRVRLGIFVGTGLLAMVIGFGVLAGMKISEKREEYVVRYDDGTISLSGLEVGSPVKYSGIKLGRVEGIRVAPDNVSVIEVRLSVPAGTPIAEDSRASLGSMGITGLKYIELTRGSVKAKVRKPGDAIPPGSSALDDLTNQAGIIAEKVSVTLDNVNAMTGPDMKERVVSLLDRADKLLETTEGLVAENRESLQQVMSRLAGTAEHVERLSASLADASGRFDKVMASMDTRSARLLDEATGLLHELRGTRGGVDETLAEARTLMKNASITLGPEGAQKMLDGINQMLERTNLLVMQTREKVAESVGYLRDTAENMTEFSQKIRDDPSLLLLRGKDNDP